MKNNELPRQVTFDDNATIKDINQIREKLKAYNRQQTNGEYDQPGIEINLALKDSENKIVGGIIVSTMLKVMHLEVLWVAGKHRKNGYGRELVLAAERIGYEKGCMTSHTWTFDFQAPNFYKKIGYTLLGVYDGYPGDLKEYVFSKRLGTHRRPVEKSGTFIKSFSNGLYITGQVTKDELEILHKGLRSYVDQFVGDEKKGIGIKLVLRDQQRRIIGGLHAWTTIHNLLVEFVWIDMPYRGIGLGTKLLLKAESMAKKNGCIASLVCPLSFQSPEFFEKLGYQIFGYSDGYPDFVQENYMIKKYSR